MGLEQSPATEGSPRRKPKRIEFRLFFALALWTIPPSVVAAILIWVNAQRYDGEVAIEHAGLIDQYGEYQASMKHERRRSCGWPCVLAGWNPAALRWEFDFTGLLIDLAAGIAVVSSAGLFSGRIATRVERRLPERLKKRIGDFVSRIRIKRASSAARVRGPSRDSSSRRNHR